MESCLFPRRSFFPASKSAQSPPAKPQHFQHRTKLRFALCLALKSGPAAAVTVMETSSRKNNPAINFQAVNHFTVCEGSHTNIAARLHLPLSQKGRGLGEGEKSLHLIGVNILQSSIKYENPAGTGSSTILEYELSRILLPRCSLFPPQPCICLYFQTNKIEDKSRFKKTPKPEWQPIPPATE